MGHVRCSSYAHWKARLYIVDFLSGVTAEERKSIESRRFRRNGVSWALNFELHRIFFWDIILRHVPTLAANPVTLASRFDTLVLRAPLLATTLASCVRVSDHEYSRTALYEDRQHARPEIHDLDVNLNDCRTSKYRLQHCLN